MTDIKAENCVSKLNGAFLFITEVYSFTSNNIVTENCKSISAKYYKIKIYF